mgnify:FL=1
MKRFLSIAIGSALFAATGFAQPTPAPEQSESILLLGGIAHLGTGDVIEGAAIGLRNGNIEFVGRERDADPGRYRRVIDVSGRHIYPGFIAANTTLGLQEIEAVRATRDYSEVGTYTPHVRSLIAYNTDSEVTPTVRTNGVLLGQPTPRGGIITGSSCVVQFDAWNWEDAAIRQVDGIHVHWPTSYHRHRDHGTLDVVRSKTYDQTIQEITHFFDESVAYAESHPHPLEGDLRTARDVRLEAMRPLFEGRVNLYVHVDDAKGIADVVHFKREYGIQNVVVVGGTEAYLVADLLRENGTSVLLNRTHALPRLPEDDVDLAFRLPKLLEDEGVLYGIQCGGRMEHMNTRNLPFYAGTAAAYGLTYEQAVRAISLNVAQILGIEQHWGSIETGKSATLFVSDGDALDMRSNRVSLAFIQGREIDLDQRQRQLYRKYQEKYNAPIID